MINEENLKKAYLKGIKDFKLVMMQDDLKYDLNEMANNYVNRQIKLLKHNLYETVLIDDVLEVEIINPVSSILVKDSRDNKLMWVNPERLTKIKK